MSASGFMQVSDGTMERLNGLLSTPTPRLNTSGIIPIDKRVLVLHDAVETKTAGGIIIPIEKSEKDKYAQTRATVIAIGDAAWAEAKYDAQQFGIKASFPEPGDRVLVGRYTGDIHKGADGTDYVVINDTDVIAFLTSEGK